MSARRLEPKVTETPGPKVDVTLRVAERSLPLLVEGQPVGHIQLVPNGDGTYTLRANSPLGVTRRSGVKPAIDVLIEAVNEFVDVLDANDEQLPEPVDAAWDRLVERWDSYRGEMRLDPFAGDPNERQVRQHIEEN